MNRRGFFIRLAGAVAAANVEALPRTAMGKLYEHKEFAVRVHFPNVIPWCASGWVGPGNGPEISRDLFDLTERITEHDQTS